MEILVIWDLQEMIGDAALVVAAAAQEDTLVDVCI
jgi:hypothetical protein